MAPLEANYFQRSSTVPVEIYGFDVQIPDYWLLESLTKKQAVMARSGKKANSVWQHFSQLPEDYRLAIGEHIGSKNDEEFGDEIHLEKWVMLHLESVSAERRPRIFSRGRSEGTVGVYLVLKQNRRPWGIGDTVESLRDVPGRQQTEHRQLFPPPPPPPPGRQQRSSVGTIRSLSVPVGAFLEFWIMIFKQMEASRS